MGKRKKRIKSTTHSADAQLFFSKFRDQRLRDAGTAVKTVIHSKRMKSKWKQKQR